MRSRAPDRRRPIVPPLAILAVVGALALVFPVGTSRARTGRAEQEAQLELVYTCPVHREVTESEPGACPICDRELVHALVQQAYSCPIHAVISEVAEGDCPICGRTLFLVTEEVSFVCPMHADVRELSEGTCPICDMALVLETAARPHQDHNPKHGGLFFMAPDNWHHLEGAYPEPGIFRVYLYDNFSQPMDAKSFQGRAVLREVFDPETRRTRETLWYPLVPAADGAYMEAEVGFSDLPRELTAKVQFESEGPFERFDFIFAELSTDVPVENAEADVASTSKLAIPESAHAIALEIGRRNEVVRELLEKGALNEIYLPALEAKDLAVALEAKLEQAPEEQRGGVRWALKQLVRSAWLLDDYGDLGNREKVYEVYDLFEEAIALIDDVYVEAGSRE